MGPQQRILIGLLALAFAAGGFTVGRALLRPDTHVLQPISFNHKKHVEMIDCDSCHQFYPERLHSGLPTLSICMDCHEDPQTESQEEEKIRQLAAAGEDEVFQKLFRLPDHVFYSHRRHVTIAGLECAECHGPVGETEAPPTVPLVRTDMDFCIGCHERQNVPNDCTRCHM